MASPVQVLKGKSLKGQEVGTELPGQCVSISVYGYALSQRPA